MKYVLIAALSVVSLNSFANLLSKSSEEKRIEKQEEAVKDAADKKEEQLKKDRKIDQQRMEDEYDIKKDKLKLQEEEAIDGLEAKEDHVD